MHFTQARAESHRRSHRESARLNRIYTVRPEQSYSFRNRERVTTVKVLTLPRLAPATLRTSTSRKGVRPLQS